MGLGIVLLTLAVELQQTVDPVLHWLGEMVTVAVGPDCVTVEVTVTVVGDGQLAAARIAKYARTQNAMKRRNIAGSRVGA